MIIPQSFGRHNHGLLIFWLVFFCINLMLVSGIGLGFFGKVFAAGDGNDLLGRPALASHMPKALPGWHKREYLASDGEAITAGARGNGLEARLAMGEDLEQFQLYKKSGITAATAVYVDGEMRIAIGLMRGMMKVPPWLEQNSYSSADWAAKIDGVHRGEVVAIVQGLAFQRRVAVGLDGSGFGYDRYVARIGHDLVVDVITNAPQIDVERLLAKIDGTALEAQLPEDSPEIDAAFGLVLHHLPASWPERLDLSGKHKLSDWVVDAE